MVAAQLALGVWALANFLKMAAVKAQLRPQLTRRSRGAAEVGGGGASGGGDSANGSTEAAGAETVRRLVPPAYTLCGGRQQAAVEWGALGPLLSLVERRYGGGGPPSRNAHERLFGEVGANGPSFYLESQKLVLFNAIVSVAVSYSFVTDGAPLPLLCLGLAPAAVAIALSPSTFLAYNWATAVEQLKDQKAMRYVLQTQRERAFQARLERMPGDWLR